MFYLITKLWQLGKKKKANDVSQYELSFVSILPLLKKKKREKKDEEVNEGHILYSSKSLNLRNCQTSFLSHKSWDHVT